MVHMRQCLRGFGSASPSRFGRAAGSRNRARRVTGVSTQQQRQIARAVKNAREMALLPYTTTGR